MDFRKCYNCGNQVNSDDNICQNCGNPLNKNISNNDNQINTNKKKKIPNILKIGIYIIIGFVLGITPVLLKEIKQPDKNNQENNNIVEDIETEDKTDSVIDNKQDEEIKNDDQEKDTDKKEEQNQDNQTITNQKPSSNNSNKQESNKNDNIVNNEETTGNEISKEEEKNEEEIKKKNFSDL